MKSPNKRKSSKSKRLLKKNLARTQEKACPSYETEGGMIDLVSESWRLARAFEASLLNTSKSERFSGQIRYFRVRLEQILATANLSIVVVEGDDFDPGMPFNVVNMDEFDGDDPLIVERVIEPAIVSPSGVKKMGTISLKRKEL